MNNLDTVRSFYVKMKSVVSPYPTKLLLNRKTEDIAAIMQSNTLCISIGDDSKLLEDCKPGNLRKIGVGVHVINNEETAALALVQKLTKSLVTDTDKIPYYDFSVNPAGVVVPGTYVRWEPSDIQFVHVDHGFNVAYWASEFDLFYYF